MFYTHGSKKAVPKFFSVGFPHFTDNKNYPLHFFCDQTNFQRAPSAWKIQKKKSRSFQVAWELKQAHATKHTII